MRKAAVKDELLRCAQDPVYFINKYVKISHPTRGLIPFKTFEYQDRTINALLKKRFNVVLKARQMGFTEVVSAFITWLVLFHPSQSVLCLATKAPTAQEVIRRVRTGLKKLPSWLLIADITVDNRMSLELANGSIVKASTKSEDAGRSAALSLLVVDEAAHIKGFDSIWTGIRPTVSAGGRIIMMSTPKGVGNVFEKTYTEAVSKKNDFNPICVMWYEHPEHISDLTIDEKGQYTSSWFRAETKGMSDREIAQEYGCSFLASGDTYFSSEMMSWVSRTISADSTMEEGLQVYSDPIPGRAYIMAADSATGKGHDRSGFHVCEIDSMDQAVEFNMKVDPRSFAIELDRIGRLYNNALLVVENNAVGLAVIEHLKLLGYPNMFYTKKGAKAGDRLGEVGNAAEGSMAPEYVHGISTQGTNRAFMLSKLEELMRLESLTIRSNRFRAEMETFIWNNGRPEAKGGKRDDLIMAMAFLVWIRDNLYGGVYNTPGLTAAMIGAMKLNRTTNVQIQGASKNPEHVPARAMGGGFSAPIRPYTVQLPNGQYIDLMREMGMFAPRRG